MSTSTNRERVPTMWVQGSPQLFQPTQRVQTHSHTHTLTHSHVVAWTYQGRIAPPRPSSFFNLYLFSGFLPLPSKGTNTFTHTHATRNDPVLFVYLTSPENSVHMPVSVCHQQCPAVHFLLRAVCEFRTELLRVKPVPAGATRSGCRTRQLRTNRVCAFVIHRTCCIANGYRPTVVCVDAGRVDNHDDDKCRLHRQHVLRACHWATNHCGVCPRTTSTAAAIPCI